MKTLELSCPSQMPKKQACLQTQLDTLPRSTSLSPTLPGTRRQLGGSQSPAKCLVRPQASAAFLRHEKRRHAFWGTGVLGRLPLLFQKRPTPELSGSGQTDIQRSRLSRHHQAGRPLRNTKGSKGRWARAGAPEQSRAPPSPALLQTSRYTTNVLSVCVSDVSSVSSQKNPEWHNI